MPFNSHVLAYYRYCFWTAKTMEEVDYFAHMAFDPYFR